MNTSEGAAAANSCGKTSANSPISMGVSPNTTVPSATMFRMNGFSAGASGCTWASGSRTSNSTLHDWGSDDEDYKESERNVDQRGDVDLRIHLQIASASRSATSYDAQTRPSRASVPMNSDENPSSSPRMRFSRATKKL